MEEKKEGKNFLKQLHEKQDEMQILGTFVRLGVVVWSGFIITLNYVDLPMIKKGSSGDITFPASIFTGTLSTFGITTSNNNNSKKKEEKE